MGNKKIPAGCGDYARAYATLEAAEIRLGGESADKTVNMPFSEAERDGLLLRAVTDKGACELAEDLGEKLADLSFRMEGDERTAVEAYAAALLHLVSRVRSDA